MDHAPYRLSESPLIRAIDRWIYVFMAAFFVVVTLVGFIPDSAASLAAIESLAAMEAGQRPRFPLLLHLHAMLIGAFLLLLLAQAILAATGRTAYHQQTGLVAVVLAPALVVEGFILVPTMYHMFWNIQQAAGPEAQAAIEEGLLQFRNIMLMQIRVGILFPLFILIGLLARKTNFGLHKRMMFLAIALALPAAFNRMTWLPQTLPASPLSPDLYMLFVVSPLFIWDLVRSGRVHKAYLIWLAFVAPSSIVIHSLWDTEWWLATAPRLVGL